MKAAILKELGGPLQIEEVPEPAIEPEEVLVKVMACGTDGTDLKMVDGFGYTPELPFILGHEIAGVVAEAGSGVSALKSGDRVIAYNFSTCGRCRFCLTHREQLCVDMAGVMGARNKHGGHAEYVGVPARQLVSLPDNVSWPDAAVIPDAVITALHAVDRARVQLGETVVIMGVGGVGSSAVQIAKLSGARVIAVDRTDEKVDRASEMGADVAVNNTETDVPKTVQEMTAGLGADCVIDCVGLEQSLAAGIDSLRPGGRLTVVGYTPELYGVNGKRLAQNELEIIGTRCGRLQDLINAVRLVAEGKIRSIVTDVYPLEEVNEAMAALRAGKVLGRAVLLTPAGQQAVGRA